MNHTEIADVFAQSYPDIELYQRQLRPVLNLLSAAPTSLPLSLVCRVLRLTPRDLDSVLDELDPVVVVVDDQLDWRYPELKVWLSEHNSDYAIMIVGQRQLADFLWKESLSFADSPYQAPGA
jgi:hypothetical protein